MHKQHKKNLKKIGRELMVPSAVAAANIAVGNAVTTVAFVLFTMVTTAIKVKRMNLRDGQIASAVMMVAKTVGGSFSRFPDTTSDSLRTADEGEAFLIFAMSELELDDAFAGKVTALEDFNRHFGGLVVRRWEAKRNEAWLAMAERAERPLLVMDQGEGRNPPRAGQFVVSLDEYLFLFMSAAGLLLSIFTDSDMELGI